MCSLVSHFCAFAHTIPSACDVLHLLEFLKNLLIFEALLIYPLSLCPPPQTSVFTIPPFSACPASIMMVALTLKCQLFILHV